MPIRQDPLKTRQHFLEDREQSVTRLGDYVADIWRLEGFNRFLRPYSSEALEENATDRPIVVVNISSVSSDSLSRANRRRVRPGDSWLHIHHADRRRSPEACVL